MILRLHNDDWIVTRQIDHAVVSGQLAGHWGNDSFARPIYRESVVLACGQHDEAWRYLDEAPLLNSETSQAHTFLSMPLDVLLPSYLDGADRVGQVDPYAGLLVAMHYQGFFNGRFGLDPDMPTRTTLPEEKPALAEFHSRLEQLRGRLRTMSAERGVVLDPATSPVIAHAYLMLQVVDGISLFLCWNPENQWPLGLSKPTIDRAPVKLTMKPVGTNIVEISPWPFDIPRIEVSFPIRRIPNRKYQSTDELREALRSARAENLNYVVACKNS